MKLKSLKGKGIGIFHNEFSLPLEDLTEKDKIIAITGNNGTGKTTLLELWLGLLNGSAPSRTHNQLSKLANAPDSYVEGSIELDQTYRMIRKINANLKNPKTEAYLFDEKGTPLNESGKQTSFEEEIKKIFPSENVLLAGNFSSQKRNKQFLKISKADRKALFAEMIGLDHLQKISKEAADRAKLVEKEIEDVKIKISALESQAEGLSENKEKLKEVKKLLEETKKQKKQAEQELKESRDLTKAWLLKQSSLEKEETKSSSELREKKQKKEHIEKEVESKKDELSKETSRLAVIESKLKEKEQLEKQVKEKESVDKEISELEIKISKEKKEINGYHEKYTEWSSKKEKAEQHLNECRENYKNAVDKADTELRRTKEKAEKQLYECKNTYEVEVHKAESSLQDIKKEKKYLTKQTSGLNEAYCGGEGEYSACVFIKGAVDAKKQLETISDKITQAEKTLKEVRDLHDSKIKKAESELRESVEKAQKTLDLAKADISTGKAAKAALEAVGIPPEKPDTSKIDRLEAVLGDLRGKQSEIIRAQDKLYSLKESEKEIKETETLIDGLQQGIGAGTKSIKDIKKIIEEIEKNNEEIEKKIKEHENNKPSEKDESDLEALRKLETEYSSDVARFSEAVNGAKQAKEQITSLKEEIKTSLEDLDDWEHLKKSFGPDGIQGLEIDAAGPEVGEIINSLLSECYGPRFTTKLETTTPKASGDGTKEIFDLFVMDSEQGREGSASDLSGGEETIVGEALSLAVSIFNTRKSSIPVLDLLRDECSGALSDANAVKYITMLRKAIEIGGFHRLYFISHQVELWDLADRVIKVEDGKVELIR